MVVSLAKSRFTSKARPSSKIQLSVEKDTFARVMNNFVITYYNPKLFHFLKHTNHYIINRKPVCLEYMVNSYVDNMYFFWFIETLI